VVGVVKTRNFEKLDGKNCLNFFPKMFEITLAMAFGNSMPDGGVDCCTVENIHLDLAGKSHIFVEV